MADILVVNAVDNLTKSVEKLTPSEYGVTSYTVVYGIPTTTSFNSKVDAYVTNKSNYISVFIDNSLEITPLSTVCVEQTTGFTLTCAFCIADVEVSTGVKKTCIIREKSSDIYTFPYSQYRALSCRKNVILFANNNMLYISDDNGRTITKAINTGLDVQTTYITFGKISDSNANKMIVFSNKGDVLISTDGGDTWAASDLAAVNNNTPVLSPFYNGCVWINNTILFGEYGTTSNRAYRIFRSTDNGLTWTVSLSKNNPGEIRHWHHLDFLPYSGKIIATSGDENNQVHWYISSDLGANWSEVEAINNMAYSQRYRTCRIQEIGYNKIMWGSDAVSRICEICTANIDDVVSTTEVIFNTAKTIFGVHVNGADIIALTDTESSDFEDNRASVYRSKDCGKAWERILEYQVQSNAGGFKACVGIDDLGEFVVVTSANGTNYYNIAISV